MNGRLRLACTCLLAGAATVAWADATTGIYSCVDARGRRFTSDRPIVECADREQKELNPSGTIRRVLPPTPTAIERAAMEEKERKASEERLRAAEQKRLDRLLVMRYPSQPPHDAERAKALQGVQDVIATAQKRIVELRDQRRKLDQETEFYQGPAKYPAALKRQLEDNDQQMAAQQRFIAAQEEEKKRIAQRFDTELARLKMLWAQQTAASEAARPVQR